jgi:[protein-PII] uridylyltransferase
MLEDAAPAARFAVVAVGGYGRGTLSPHSDVDVWLVSPRGGVGREAVRALLYPLWDAGFQVGHSIGTPKDMIDRAAGDLHLATALIHARFVAGATTCFEELLDRRARWLRRDGKQFVRRVREATAERHRTAERAGWSLAPDLKEDIGGLRDLHTVSWLEATAAHDPPPKELVTAGELLLAVREALHGEVRHRSDRLPIDLQPRVATRLGLDGTDAADRLMTELHTAARVIEHLGARASRTLAERVLGGPRRSGEVRSLDRGVILEDGVLVARGAGGVDPLAHALRLLAAQAATGRPVAPGGLEWLTTCFRTEAPASWTSGMRSAFLRLLRGPHAPATLELLDHVGGSCKLIPEWEQIRGRAQHDPYHRHTVDGHSFLTVGEISRTISQEGPSQVVSREGGLDPLYLAALLHDVGKGSGEDHSVAGERLARAACRRIGVSAEDVEEVAALVRHHLLLPDTATRRDLDDGAVISDVANRVGSSRRLRLLYILARADGVATGPTAWTDWKASLVLELYHKVLTALDTGEVPPTALAARAREIETYEPALSGRARAMLSTFPPSYLDSAPVEELAKELSLVMSPPDAGEVRYRMDGHPDSRQATLTVCTRDRPGTLARTAGVLTLNRLAILKAQAYSTSSGLALDRFTVATRPEVSWKRVIDNLRGVYSGRLALEARLDRKARDYLTGSVEVEVRVLQKASSHSTIVEVRAPDALGLLYAVVAGISDLDLDIHVAKIDTRAGRVVDVFYVRTLWGTKLNDDQVTELTRSVTHRVERMFG